MQVKAELTFGDLEQMPENGKRYELHEGEVFVTAAPRVDHQDVCLALGGLLRRVLKPRGRIYLGVDAYFTETTVYIPDVVFIRRENFGRITRRTAFLNTGSSIRAKRAPRCTFYERSDTSYLDASPEMRHCAARSLTK